MEGGTIIIDAASPKLNRWKWFRIKSLVTMGQRTEKRQEDQGSIMNWRRLLSALLKRIPAGDMTELLGPYLTLDLM